MDFAHLHLLLNHVPIIGTMVGLGLFLLSFFANTQDLRRASFVVFVATALLTIPAFMTGIGAQVEILASGGVSNDLIQRHQGSAELTVWFMQITGAFSTVALWRSRRPVRTSRWNTVAVLFFSLVTAGLLARTGNTGGEIRHPEIRYEQAASRTERALALIEPSPRSFTRLMTANKWWWAFMMTLHFIGLALLIGTIGLLDLRILGFLKQLPIGPLNELVPWGLFGFGINVVTGILAFIGMSTYYTYDIAFVLKMVIVLAAVSTLALFYMTNASHECESIGPGESAPLPAKINAGLSLLLWLAVIVLGRYIQPLDGTIPH
jgi:hypothetical protein